MPCVLYILNPVFQFPATANPASDSDIDSIPLVMFTLNKPDNGSNSPVTSQYSEPIDSPSVPLQTSSLRPSPGSSNQEDQSVFVLFRPFVNLAYLVSKKRKRPFSQRMSSKPGVSKRYPLYYSEDDITCSICLCDYEQDDILRRMVCGHHFHKDCLDEWLKINRVCPLCKDDCLGGPAHEPTDRTPTSSLTSSPTPNRRSAPASNPNRT
ncbi:E3 ubiquitin-protein ligase RNF38 [Smittium mucronatum]|uniref:E3 ubiquitin-protein ligase RNF38 n=1 Tax=Smittium mucronatum TaxID=133383 RepID=A0A1R0H9C5_9FUNG|nr:E3 ubiquitin-protein ligase RNF38 [Smittium mucronatum]